MRVLDLFCGAGGAAMGLHQAWPDAEIMGVDIKPQPRYPFTFVQADVMTLTFKLRMQTSAPLEGFDFIWASPPCQAYSDLRERNRGKYPELIEPTRIKLIDSGKPFVIENVDRAPLFLPEMLCGTMFGLKVFRHRIFETNWGLTAPEHKAHNGATGTHRWPYKREGGYVQVTGGGNCTIAEAKDAMQIDWMTKAELNEAIPPAYSRYIAEQFTCATERRRAGEERKS